MKRLLSVFELSKNEQRVVLIVVLLLVVIAIVSYERRVHPQFQQTSATEPKPSPSVVETRDGD
jgi:ABC-type Fe3+ transport system permease subunit